MKHSDISRDIQRNMQTHTLTLFCLDSFGCILGFVTENSNPSVLRKVKTKKNYTLLLIKQTICVHGTLFYNIYHFILGSFDTLQG